MTGGPRAIRRDEVFAPPPSITAEIGLDDVEEVDRLPVTRFAAVAGPEPSESDALAGTRSLDTPAPGSVMPRFPQDEITDTATTVPLEDSSVTPPPGTPAPGTFIHDSERPPAPEPAAPRPRGVVAAKTQPDATAAKASEVAARAARAASLAAAAMPREGYEEPSAPEEARPARARRSERRGAVSSAQAARHTSPRRRRRLGTWLLLAGVPLVCGIAATVGTVYYMGERTEKAIVAAIRVASDDGLRTSYDHALVLASRRDDPAALARRARLHATLYLEHGDDEAGERATTLLDRRGDVSQGRAEAGIARIYVALAQADVETARRASIALPSDPAVDVEAARARASTALALGKLERAVSEAKVAVEERPTSPRHVALFAEITGLLGDRAAALAALDGVDADGSPAVRLARARIHARAGAYDVASSEAQVVLGPLSELASAPEKARAERVLGEVALAEEKAEAARAHFGAALEEPPPGDGEHMLGIAAGYLALGDIDAARKTVADAPETPAQAHARASVMAEIHLADGALDELAAVIGDAAPSAATSYLQGRLAEARGDIDVAIAKYESAANEASQFVRARARLGGIALRRGEVGHAITILEPAQERKPASIEVVPLLVDALLAARRTDRAEAVVDAALERLPEAAPLLVAKARVNLAADHVDEALAVLEGLTAAHPDDAVLQATLGEAARRSGDPEKAAAAYGRALEIAPGNPTALVGLVELAVEAADVESAQGAIAQAEQAGISGAGLDRARAQLLVLEGKGQEAVADLRRYARRARGDADLWAALGRAYAQAESYRAARNAFEQALKHQRSNVEAHLGLALVLTRLGDLGRAARSVAAAERAVERQELGARYEARTLAARGRLRFEVGAFADAKELAVKAIEKDEDAAEAHFLLAMIAVEANSDPIEHLRRANQGRATLPEAVAQLALRLPAGEERCVLARKYLSAAPRGYDARNVKRVLRRCR